MNDTTALVSTDKKYIRVTNFKDAELVDPSELSKWENKTDFYASRVIYNQKHFEHFQKEKSVAGIRDVNCDTIWFDFDLDKTGKTGPDQPQKDAYTVVTTLKKHDVPQDNIEIWYSGNKGFHVIVNLDKEIPFTEVKKLVFGKYAVGLVTIDPSVYLPTQVLRLPNSKHGKSGLYKVQLTQEELNTLSLDEIREIAKKNEKIEPVEKKKLPESFYNIKGNTQNGSDNAQKGLPAPELKSAPKKEVSIDSSDPLNFKGLDLSSMPHGWKDFKWAIAQGRFNIGERHSAMMVVCATCRALKYGKDMTEAICQKADELHCDITGDKPMSDLQTCVDSVFAPNWSGGQYSPEKNLWLQKYCLDNGFETEDKKAELSDRAFHMVPIGELYKFKDTKEWTVDNLFAESGLCLIAGPSKSGKSTLIRQLAKCILRGEDFLGRKCKKGKLFWFGLEEQQEDLNAGFKKLGIHANEDLHVHVGAPLSLKAIEDLMILLCEEKPVMAVIDTLFDLVQVESENSYNEVKTQLARLSHVARMSGTTIITIHHTKHPQQGDSKRGMRAILGSTAILGKMDSALVMESEQKRRYITTAGRSIHPWDYREILFDFKTQIYSLGPVTETDDWA